MRRRCQRNSVSGVTSHPARLGRASAAAIAPSKLRSASVSQAQQLCADLAERLGSLGLELHPDKTKIVYCKDTKRRDEAQHTSFDFLGYTFGVAWPVADEASS